MNLAKSENGEIEDFNFVKQRSNKMERVYLLQHVREIDADCDDIKIIGIFTSKEKAQMTIKRCLTLPGFKEYPESFYIDEYFLNEDNWSEGFITR